ncbi:MAG TPA: CHAT domain-containing protein [Thermoanaerobaculia bacterium]|nr:CHAT domain-containing protein [Thermoanaerobaculia bacterium]
MNDRVSRHPTEEILAAFIEGSLARPEIAEVLSHMRDCPECRTSVARTADFYDQERRRGVLEEEETPATRRTGISRRWWLLAAAIVIAVVAVWRLVPPGRNNPMSILVQAAPQEHRRVDARISGFPWAAFEAQQRGSGVADPADLKLSGAAGAVLEQTERKNDAESLHAQGVALLLIERLSESIAALERAANSSNDARTWNDLAAARYALVEREERLSQLPLALAAADRALGLDPQLAEAHFNRALILQRMGLSEQARKSWDSYLALDPGSEWSLEARARLRSLDGNKPRTEFRRRTLDELVPDVLVRQFPQESRTWSEGILLGEWADAEHAGDAAVAKATLEHVHAIATALAAANGERLLDDAVGAIEHADENARSALVEAHRTYRDGRVTFSLRKDIRAAEEKFRWAEELFRRGQSPMENMAAYFAASATFHQNRVEEAYDALLRLAPEIDRTRHRALTAQLHWELAVHANVNADWGAAVREAGAAAQIFGALGERANEADMQVMATPALESIGETDLAWKQRLAAIGAMTPARQQGMLHAAAASLASRDEVVAAAAVLEAVIDEAREDNPVLLAFALADRARLAGRSGNTSSARCWLDDARDAAMRLRDPALRDVAMARVVLADAVVQPSVASSDRAIQFFVAKKHGRLLPEAYLQRARAQKIAGNEDAALVDYAAALSEIEKQQKSILDPSLRPALLDTAGPIIDETIALRLARGEVAKAFRAADRTRASTSAEPRVPHGAAVLEYAVLPHAIAIFCITDAGVSAATVKVNRRDLGSGVRSLAQIIRSRAPEGDVEAAGALLFRWLIAPVRARLGNATELVIVPDHELYGIPFAALFDAQRERYLVEDFTIRFASSASAFTKGPSVPLQPAVVIADPPTPHFPRLPHSREEARRIASLHDATLLAGKEATAARFADAARDSTLIHFSGHADSNARDSYAALLFAGDAGVLGMSDIARLRLRRHPLVILAACGTFRGDTMHVAGMPSLARAFLTAGARAVVGTLWEIDDDVSATLFLRFHELLRTGASPATALRTAQLEMLRSPNPRWKHPASWSAQAVLTNHSDPTGAST